MQLRWSHAVLHVRDMEVMIDFYTKVLGFEVTDRGGFMAEREIVFMSQVATDHHQIAFVSGREEIGPSNSHDHMAFRVDVLADVREVAARLEADGRGSKPLPLTHGNAWSVYFRDPEGNGVEVFCDSPWHVKQPQAQGWDLAQSDAELEAETRAKFESDSEFGPIDDYYAAREKALRDR